MNAIPSIEKRYTVSELWVIEWIERLLQKTVNLGSIPGQVKPKTIKIDIDSFPAGRTVSKGIVRSLKRTW